MTHLESLAHHVLTYTDPHSTQLKIPPDDNPMMKEARTRAQSTPTSHLEEVSLAAPSFPPAEV